MSKDKQRQEDAAGWATRSALRKPASVAAGYSGGYVPRDRTRAHTVRRRLVGVLIRDRQCDRGAAAPPIAPGQYERRAKR